MNGDQFDHRSGIGIRYASHNLWHARMTDDFATVVSNIVLPALGRLNELELNNT